MIIGQMLQMKMAKIADGSAERNSNRPIGSQASGDTGRSRLMTGPAASPRKRKRPITKPSGMPTSAAAPKPSATRRSEASTFQPMPWSLGELR